MLTKRSVWLISSLSVAVLVLVFFLFKRPNNTPPNIIWFSIDTLRAKSLKAYNYDKETAPTISQLARQGVVFESAIAQGPVTQISHFSMLTGTYPFKHKILTIDLKNRLSPNIKIAAEYFKENGYSTILSGFFEGNPALNPDFGLKRGADHLIPHDPLKNTEQRKIVVNTLNEMALSKKPIFAFFHTQMVHGPYLPSQECLEENKDRYTGKMLWNESSLINLFKNFPRPSSWAQDKNWEYGNLFFHLVDMSSQQDLKQLRWLYDGAIRCMDNELNHFLASIKNTLPSPDNTIIIITADHGESLGEHNYLQHGNMTEENLKVPLIITFPNKKGLRIQAPVRSIDILPSILDYLGIKIPEYIDGKSFLPLLDHPEQKVHFDYAFTHHRDSYAVYHQQFKYIFNKGDEELYDLSNDPNEQKNLITEQPDTAYQLESEYFKYLMDKNN